MNRQVNAHAGRTIKAQGLSDLNLRLSTCLRPTQLCGGGQTK
ncbi:hypothetical protein [Globicatella sanguinis]